MKYVEESSYALSGMNHDINSFLISLMEVSRAVGTLLLPLLQRELHSR